MKYLAAILFLPISLFAQYPQIPQFGTFNKISSNSPTHLSPRQNNANEIIRQQNNQAQRTMGYKPPPTQADIQRNLQQQYELRQRNVEAKQMQSVTNLIRKEYIEYAQNPKYYWQAEEYKHAIKNFEIARDRLNEMLVGTRPISLQDAFYNVEAATGNIYQNYDEFNFSIKQSADFIKQWMLENSLDVKDQASVHYSIQRFMGDTLFIKGKTMKDVSTIISKTAHLPFKYDYIDNHIEQDIRNYNATKTLATGTGQCHTLPLIYLLLAEAMDVDAYLSLATLHSFIKYKDNNGTIHNYEATSDWHMTDQDYSDWLYIRSTAVKNRLYLDTLNKKQIVANTLLDLAYYHNRIFGTADGKFVNSCIDIALSYLPNGVNETAIMMKSGIYANELMHLLHENGIYDLKDIDKVQGARVKYEQLVKNEEYLHSLGYQELPDGAYQALLTRDKNRMEQQLSGNINTKQKKSLFFTLNK